MEYTVSNVAPIVLLPLMAFVINAFWGRKLYRQGDWLSTGAIFVSFLYSLRIFFDFMGKTHNADNYVHKTFTWIDLSYLNNFFQIDMGIYIDNMSAVMLLMVSGVATLIHLFSTFYMEGDSRYGKFFTFLSLFSAAMLGLVLSDNLLSFFIFWEIMGFCSYSLIGFYTEKEEAGNASMKAFMTTRVGDVCFLLGIVAIWNVVGSVGLVDIYSAIAMGKLNGQFVLGLPLATFAGLCIFLGTIGKSAQFPLQVWLPDAMMGPTPCSALIHAATMVAAGVFLSLRIYPLLEMGGLSGFVAFIGALTAFGAATIALVQTDIKAVLAFSTISQLGYMVMGIGVGSYNPAFMHLITHAIFKACLFLSAGSVIHSLHDQKTHGHVQEMPRMGGLREKMPYTFFAMLCCSLAIAGMPVFSAFVSKDRILGDALYWGLHSGSKLALIVPILGYLAAFLTAFYMFRMMFLTFFGRPRDKELFDHCHTETLSFNRNVPLLILSLFTLGVFFSGTLTGQGFVKIPVVTKEWFQTLIQKPKVEKFTNYKSQHWGQTDSELESRKNLTRTPYDPTHGIADEHKRHKVHLAHVYGAIASFLICIAGIFTAYMMYYRRIFKAEWWAQKFPRYYRALQNKYFFDYFYIKVLLQKGLLPFNKLLAYFDMNIFDKYAIDGWSSVNRWAYRASGWFDNNVVDSTVDGAGVTVKIFNVFFRTLQSGKVQMYFSVLILVLSWFIWVFAF